MNETLNKFRWLILENPETPKVYLVSQEGLTYEDAHEMLAVYTEQGKTDMKIEEYYPDADRLGRNPDLH